MSESQLNMASKANSQPQGRSKLAKMPPTKPSLSQQQPFKPHLPKDTAIQPSSTPHRPHDVAEDSSRDPLGGSTTSHNNRRRKRVQEASDYEDDEPPSPSRTKPPLTKRTRAQPQSSLPKTSATQSSKSDKRKKPVATSGSLSQPPLNTSQKSFINGNGHLLDDAVNGEGYGGTYGGINRGDPSASQRRTAFVDEGVSVGTDYTEEALEMDRDDQDMQDTLRRLSATSRRSSTTLEPRSQAPSRSAESQSQSQAKSTESQSQLQLKTSKSRGQPQTRPPKLRSQPHSEGVSLNHQQDNQPSTKHGITKTSRNPTPINPHPAKKAHAPLKSQSSLDNRQFPSDSIQPQMQLTNTITKAEAEAFGELMTMTRRYYLTYLCNKIVDEPVRAVFPGMRSTHPTFKTAQERVKKSYKGWKTGVLEHAQVFVERWINNAKPDVGRYRANLNTHRDIKEEFAKGFCNEWLDSVFFFAKPAVDFDDVENEGMRFIKYAFLQIVTVQRLNELHQKDTTDRRFTKYTRKFLLDVYDALYLKQGFETQTVDFYPERTRSVSVHQKTPKVDVNQDSDFSVDEDPVPISEESDDERHGQSRVNDLADEESQDNLDYQ